MKQKPLSELTKSDLVIEVQKRKQFYIIYIVILSVILLSGIIESIKNGVGVFTIVPLAFIPIMLLVRKNAIEAKKELDSRS